MRPCSPRLCEDLVDENKPVATVATVAACARVDGSATTATARSTTSVTSVPSNASSGNVSATTTSGSTESNGCENPTEERVKSDVVHSICAVGVHRTSGTASRERVCVVTSTTGPASTSGTRVDACTSTAARACKVATAYASLRCLGICAASSTASGATDRPITCSGRAKKNVASNAASNRC